MNKFRLRDRIGAAIVGTCAGLSCGLLVTTIGLCFVPAYIKLNPTLLHNEELSNELYEDVLVSGAALSGVLSIAGLALGAAKPNILD